MVTQCLFAPFAEGDLFNTHGNMAVKYGLNGEVAAIAEALAICRETRLAPRNMGT
jgi:hypothetical protein